MDLQLKNKKIIVTGGSQGIGGAISKMLAIEGAIPIILSRNEKDNQEMITQINRLGSKAYAYTVELGIPENLSACCKLIEKDGHDIDGLVNNAGVNDGVSLEKGTYQQFINSLHNNLIHIFLLTQWCLPYLKKNKGTILNIGSKVAETGQGNTSAYAAAKGAINALTREWAVELLPYNIRVNTIIVAECYTPLYEKWLNTLENPKEKLQEITNKIPLGKRITTTEEIAATATFLLSYQSSHTTGQLIYVDGGYVHLDRAIK